MYVQVGANEKPNDDEACANESKIKCRYRNQEVHLLLRAPTPILQYLADRLSVAGAVAEQS